jgi:hypothetical protein
MMGSVFHRRSLRLLEDTPGVSGPGPQRIIQGNGGVYPTPTRRRCSTLYATSRHEEQEAIDGQCAHLLERRGVVCVRMVIGELRSQRDFDTLDRVHQQQTQLAVKDVPLPSYIEVSARIEGVIGLLSMKPVTA